jgi:hypothetical protein
MEAGLSACAGARVRWRSGARRGRPFAEGGEAGFGVSKTTYDLVTGKAYSLKIKSTGAKDCAWEAPEFANAIWVRKVEAGEVEIKFSHLREIEFEREGEAEIFFVPIRPRNLPWRCRGLEGKGMAGAFVVK